MGLAAGVGHFFQSIIEVIQGFLGAVVNFFQWIFNSIIGVFQAFIGFVEGTLGFAIRKSSRPSSHSLFIAYTNSLQTISLFWVPWPRLYSHISSTLRGKAPLLLAGQSRTNQISVTKRG